MWHGGSMLMWWINRQMFQCGGVSTFEVFVLRTTSMRKGHKPILFYLPLKDRHVIIEKRRRRR
jgi:hypothetical protein